VGSFEEFRFIAHKNFLLEGRSRDFEEFKCKRSLCLLCAFVVSFLCASVVNFLCASW